MDINFNSDVKAGVDSAPLKPQEKPQIVYLQNVEFIPDFEMGEGDKAKKDCIIKYTFSDGIDLEKSERKSNFMEFNPETAKEPQKAFDRLKQRWANIYWTYYGKLPDEKFFSKCKSIKDVMQLMADSLSKGTKDKKPVYFDEKGQPKKVWIKLVYYNNFVTLPLNRFIEPFREGKEPKIEVQPSDVIVKAVGKKKNADGGAGTFNIDDDLPM